MERKACHNCRTRRLRCDRSIPTCHKCTSAGLECLGYGRLIKWTGAVAVRGRMAGKQRWTSASSRSLSSSSSSAGTSGTPLVVGGCLTDPLFQDTDPSSRRYLDYFVTRFCQDMVVHHPSTRGTNPFRLLVPMSARYPFLRHIITASAAIHYSNLMRLSSSSGSSGSSSSLQAARSAVVDALRIRHEAILALQKVLTRYRLKGAEEGAEKACDADAAGEKEALLATVLFFINFALLDGGKGGWRVHMAAARSLLSGGSEVPDDRRSVTTASHAESSISSSPALSFTSSLKALSSSGDTGASTPTSRQTSIAPSSVGLSSNISIRDFIASDFIAYYIWGSAIDSFAMPSSLPSSTTTISSSSLPSTITASPSPSLSSSSSPSPSEEPLINTVDILPFLLRTEYNAYHSCPAHILHLIFRTSRLAADISSSSSHPTPHHLRQCLALLAEAQSFDVDSWASSVCARAAAADVPQDELDPSLRAHTAATFRAAACLYIMLVAPGLQTYFLQHQHQSSSPSQQQQQQQPFMPTTEDYVTSILESLSLIPPTSPLFKYSTWPLFITGVGTSSAPRRAWVRGRLDAIWQLCPWGMIVSAMDTLELIWRVGDEMTVGGDLVAAGGDDAGLDGQSNYYAWLRRLREIGIDCLVV